MSEGLFLLEDLVEKPSLVCSNVIQSLPPFAKLSLSLSVSVSPANSVLSFPAFLLESPCDCFASPQIIHE